MWIQNAPYMYIISTYKMQKCLALPELLKFELTIFGKFFLLKKSSWVPIPIFPHPRPALGFDSKRIFIVMQQTPKYCVGDYVYVAEIRARVFSKNILIEKHGR